MYPVGARLSLGGTDAAGHPAFKLLRGLESQGDKLTHTGADLGCGRAGDTVRAAASGIVVLAGWRDDGYGRRIVLAHRLPEGTLAYTVYAHLGEGTARVHAGERVCAGDALARVGQTGRASTPHLHFEVRAADDASERWENTRVLDPLVFLSERLPARLEGDRALSPYVEWAQCEGLLSPGSLAADALTNEAWWRMLAGAAALSGPPASRAPEALRDTLIAAGVLPEEAAGNAPGAVLGWKECARDVHRLAEVGVRMAHGPLPRAEHRARCRAQLGSESPATATGALRHRHGAPCTADACVLLADLSGPLRVASLPSAHHARPKRARRTKPHRAHA